MTHDAHNFTIGAVSSIPSASTAALMITQADIPLWLYLVIAIVMPPLMVMFGKAIDIGYQEWKAKRGR